MPRQRVLRTWIPGTSGFLLLLGAISCLLLSPSTLLVGPPSHHDVLAAGVADVLLYSEDFEEGEAPGWDLPSEWAVVPEGSGKALRGTGHAVASYLENEWGDFTFTLRVRVDRGGVHLLYRAGGCTRYFVFFGEENLILSRTNPCGTHTQLKSKTGNWKTKRWYDIAIVGAGGSITISIDGSSRLTYSDSAPLLYGSIGLEVLDGSQALFDDIRVTGQPPPDLGLTWVRTGGPLGGLGYDIRMSPDNPDLLYVTDASSGAHISRDGGVTWAPSTEGITTRAGASGDAIPAFSVTIDRHNPSIVWLGTQNRRGIYKSVNGGLTWVEKDTGVVETEGVSFRGFTVDPRSSDIVYAAAEISSFAWAGEPRLGKEFDLTKGVVYKTTDGGAHWSAVWRGDSLARYVWIDPQTPDTVYVSTGFYDREAANVDVAKARPGGVGILKSVDGGKTWRALNGSNGLENLYIGSLFMHPRDSQILLAAAGSGTWRDKNGVYLSEDGGESWRRVLDQDGESFTAVEFAVSDSSVAYAGSELAMYRSNDRGHSWVQVSNRNPWGPPGVRIGIAVDIQVDPRNADRLFVNSYGGGNFLSDDGGRTWSAASTGYTGAFIHNLAIVPEDSRTLYAIGRSGPFRTFDGGASWQGLAYPPLAAPEWYTIVLDPSDPALVFASDESDGDIYRSPDGGQNWDVVFDHPAGNPQTYREWRGFKAIAFAPSNTRSMYAGMSRFSRYIDEGGREPSFGIYKSTDGGLSWRPSNDAESSRWNINCLAVDPRTDQTVYAGTVDGGVLKTTDGGTRWSQANTGLRSLDIRSLAIDPSNPLAIFAGAENGGLYKSVDGGTTWKQSSNGMDPQGIIRSIVVDPVDTKILFAGDLRTGVYRSSDAGVTWLKINNGLRTRAVKALAISSDGSTLYAGTEGEGVFRLDLSPAGG